MHLPRKLLELVDAIGRDRLALLDSANGLTEAQLNFKPADDQWSISDVLHHLALADEANAKLTGFAAKQADAGVLQPDPTPDESMLGCMDAFAGSMGKGAQAPERVAPKSHLPVDESLQRLRASREKILEMLPRISPYDLSTINYPHPLLGPLNYYQWLFLAGWHEARHVAQIGRIKSSPGFPAQ
ncbi:MAG TPA: DinB family protein [Blastocatellia bacterium]|nr:DinB family protein [Blastocatellia bacterium]